MQQASAYYIAMSQYDFRVLSSLEFERLTRDILQRHWSVFLESFKTGRDGGIDFRFARVKGRSEIVQCKHFVGSGFAKLMQVLSSEELPKIRRLAPHRYYLVTSVPLSPVNKQSIVDVLAPFVDTASIFGPDDLNNLLAQQPDVERRHFKLWLSSINVLDSVIHSDVYANSSFASERIKEKLSLFVQNDSVQVAMNLLDAHHCCIVSGIPGIGKTTLAEMLILAHLKKGYELVAVSSDANDALRVMRQGKKQVFFYDDFLGRTALSEKLAKNEDARLVGLIEAVRRSKVHRLVMTTREYILRQAREVYERLGDEEVTISKLVLDVGSYTTRRRAEMLINHLEVSRLPMSTVSELIRSGVHRKIVRHRNFSPRIVEWMTVKSMRGADLAGFGDEFLLNLENPERLWLHALRSELSPNARWVCLVLLSLGGAAMLDEVEVAVQAVVGRLERESFDAAVREVDGSFVQTRSVDEQLVVRFHNPSIEDALKNLICSEEARWVELLKGSSYFSQVVELVRLLRGLRVDVSRTWLVRNARLLCDKLSGLVVASPTRAEKAEQIDNLLSRVNEILEVAIFSNVPMIASLASDVVRRVGVDAVRVAHSDALARLLRLSEQASLDAALVAGLRREIAEEIERGMEMAEDYRRFCELDASFPGLFSPGVRADVERRLREFVSSSFAGRSSLRDWDDFDILSSSWGDVSTAAEYLHVDLSAVRDDVQDRLDDLRRPEPDDDDRWDQGAVWGSQDEPTDRELDELFDAIVIR